MLLALGKSADGIMPDVELLAKAAGYRGQIAGKEGCAAGLRGIGTSAEGLLSMRSVFAARQSPRNCSGSAQHDYRSYNGHDQSPPRTDDGQLRCGIPHAEQTDAN